MTSQDLDARLHAMPFPLGMEEVRKTEERLGRKLPITYVAKMTKENGGYVDAGGDGWHLHPLLDGSDAKRFARTCNDVVRETAEMRAWEDWPDEALAIAANGGRDCLVLLPDPDSDRFGDQVYLWSHETGDLEPVADDFADLEGASR